MNGSNTGCPDWVLGFRQMAKTKEKAAPEFSSLKNWRYVQLRNLGLAPDEAMSLVSTVDVVNAATKLAKQGCPPKLIVSLLKD